MVKNFFSFSLHFFSLLFLFYFRILSWGSIPFDSLHTTLMRMCKSKNGRPAAESKFYSIGVLFFWLCRDCCCCKWSFCSLARCSVVCTCVCFALALIDIYLCNFPIGNILDVTFSNLCTFDTVYTDWLLYMYAVCAFVCVHLVGCV